MGKRKSDPFEAACKDCQTFEAFQRLFDELDRSETTACLLAHYTDLSGENVRTCINEAMLVMHRKWDRQEITGNPARYFRAVLRNEIRQCCENLDTERKKREAARQASKEALLMRRGQERARAIVEAMVVEAGLTADEEQMLHERFGGLGGRLVEESTLKEMGERRGKDPYKMDRALRNVLNRLRMPPEAGQNIV